MDPTSSRNRKAGTKPCAITQESMLSVSSKRVINRDNPSRDSRLTLTASRQEHRLPPRSPFRSSCRSARTPEESQWCSQYAVKTVSETLTCATTSLSNSHMNVAFIAVITCESCEDGGHGHFEVMGTQSIVRRLCKNPFVATPWSLRLSE